MTQPTIRIRAYFAEAAPVCILLRRGPSKMSHMIKWHTDTDEFEVGQWIKGRVDGVSLSSDGKYMGIEVMTGEQYAAICRPPYFVPIEIDYGGLCCGVTALFYPGDRLMITDRNRTVNSRTPCPFERVGRCPGDPTQPFMMDASEGEAHGFDQAGRLIWIKEAKLFAIEEGKPRLLLDMATFRPQEIEIPDWARDY